RKTPPGATPRRLRWTPPWPLALARGVGPRATPPVGGVTSPIPSASTSTPISPQPSRGAPERLSNNPSPQPPPRDGEGEKDPLLPHSASGRGGGGRGFETPLSSPALVTLVSQGAHHRKPACTPAFCFFFSRRETNRRFRRIAS